MPASERDPRLQWFVMRDLTRPNALRSAWQVMSEAGHEVFTPMTWRIRSRGGRKVKEKAPVIHDLLFIRSTRRLLDPDVEKLPTLQYRYIRGGGYREAMVVPDAEMQRFIDAVRTDDDPRYYAAGEITEAMVGRRVRIVGGALGGFKGNLLSVKGMRKKRIIVDLIGMISAAVEVEAEYIELVDD